MEKPPSQEQLDALHAIANHTSIVLHGLAALQPFVDSQGRGLWCDCDRGCQRLVESVRHLQELVRRG